MYFKRVKAGTPLSYGRTYVSEVDENIATIPVGYGDGYFRSMSGKAQLLMGGKAYPIVGTITMDQIMVDIGGDSAYNGDEVILIGEMNGESISVEDLAEWAGTIPYEILTNINTRVPRIYAQDS